ncbi:hypothetical protein ASF78_20025 [Cellulomonas sp. Leaf334]|nr:hypothetical protein ASF78_20025 [Cellulomonas sp. Leaf334]
MANFQTVLDEPTRDIAAAISAHLVAVALYGDGALDEAKNRVELSVSIGREIEDERGLAFTLSTLGRVELALSNRTGSVEAARRAITALDEATKYAENYDVLGRTLQYLAEAQLKIGHGEDAQRLGYEAIEISQYGERAVEARTAAALIERELGNESSYQALLSDAEEIAARDGVGGRSLAKLLNMEASSRRRSGDMSGALALAKRSLALGRRLNDRRHVAHAAHTLAAITIDLLPVSSDIPADLDEARKLLEESRTALVRLRDARGIQLVDASLRRLSSAAALAEFTTDES